MGGLHFSETMQNKEDMDYDEKMGVDFEKRLELGIWILWRSNVQMEFSFSWYIKRSQISMWMKLNCLMRENVFPRNEKKRKEKGKPLFLTLSL